MVKSRVQNLKKGAGANVGVSAVIRDAIAKDGMTVFFRGLDTGVLRLQPQTTLLSCSLSVQESGGQESGGQGGGDVRTNK